MIIWASPTPWGGIGDHTKKGEAMIARHRIACALGALTFVLATPARADSDKDSDRDRDRDKTRTTTVDCAAGETVAKALTRGDDRKSLTILIKGTCTES